MADFKKRFESRKQEWATPDVLFATLSVEFKFDVDLAADRYNTKCQVFFDEQADALVQEWNGVCWLNPPFGDKKHKLIGWIRKSWRETQKDGCTVVMLIPARTNTKWWHDYCMRAHEVRFICGRPRFGNSDHGLPLPLAIVVFKKHQGNTKFSSLFYGQQKEI